MSQAQQERQVRAMFAKANFINALGVAVTALGPGRCETELVVRPDHLQQDGFVHAGVQASLADHTAGGAAGMALEEGEAVLSIEFKINLLRPAVGQKLRAVAAVLRAGKTVVVTEAEVFSVEEGGEKLCSKATVTLARVRREP